VTKDIVALLEFRMLQHPHGELEREGRDHFDSQPWVHPVEDVGDVGLMCHRQGPSDLVRSFGQTAQELRCDLHP
jgi:hypothetical protein